MNRSFVLSLVGSLATIMVAPPVAHSAVVVRQNVYSLSAPQLQTLAKGVAAMKKKNATDPTSWAYQAAMHGTDTTPAKALWNTCQHGSYYFLSWHRMYLYYFERILRKASGDPNFALPYWSYAQAAQRALPPTFRSPAAASNPLWVAQRSSEMNGGAHLPASAVSTTAAMNTVAFASSTGSGAGFGGQKEPGAVHFGSPHGRLESTPHDVVHVVVGGDTGWMSDPNTAAQDPIFWLHHANIDRLWKQWLRKGNGRANPTSDTVWMNTTFSFFDEDGHQVQMSGKDILDTVEKLGYRYDDEPAPALVANNALASATVSPAADTEEDGKRKTVSATNVELGDTPVSARLAPLTTAAPRFAKVAADLSTSERITLHLDDIQYDRSPGHFFEVYVNLPDDVSEPNFQSPHYVGNLATFALKHRHGGAADPSHPMPSASQTFDITATARALKAFGRWSDRGDLTVTLVARRAEMAGGKTPLTKKFARVPPPKVTIGRISVTVD